MKNLAQISLIELSRIKKSEMEEILEENKSFLGLFFNIRNAPLLFPLCFIFMDFLYKTTVEDKSIFIALKNEALYNFSQGNYTAHTIFGIFLFLCTALPIFFSYIRIKTWNTNRQDKDFNDKIATLNDCLRIEKIAEANKAKFVKTESEILIKKLKTELKEKNISETDFWLEFKEIYF